MNNTQGASCNNKLLLFAGTTEGRELAEYLDRQELSCTVCVATEYGEELILDGTTHHQVLAKRLDQEAMEQLIRAEGFTMVVDATHPYAAVVTANIKSAAESTGIEYLRLLRGASTEGLMSGVDGAEASSGEAASGETDPAEAASPWVSVGSVKEAVEFLAGQEGKILAATGSRELKEYTAIPDYKERVIARILSTKESMDIADSLGFAGKNLICMQGPFSEAINTAMLRDTGAVWMVTKESGKTGGFPEKVRAAQAAGAKLVVVGRPTAETGYSPEEIRKVLCERMNIKVKRQISLIGIGMGTREGMTVEAWENCEKADVLIGARRMLDAAKELNKPEFVSYKPDEIKAFADAHTQYEKVAVLLSGDVGFYSGANKLEKVFEGEKLQVLCGISSVEYLCAKLHRSWDDAKLVSLHGRTQNLIAAVRTNKKVFAIVGKQESFREMCILLQTYGFGDVTVHAGCSLSYPDEQILSGTAWTLEDAQTGDLTAVLIENPYAQEMATHGVEDDAYIRAKVPMTKLEVRSLSLTKLRLNPDSIVYDVGAGTGSVSIEAALRCPEGMVYAIEKKAEAVDLIGQNARKMGTPNLEVVAGLAPEAMEGLPVPTHAFIGGSSGNMREIVDKLLAANPQVRIVINAIALETVAETMDMLPQLPITDVDIVCINAARSKTLGRYHMMTGQNPVYVISFEGKAPEESAEEITEENA